MAGPALVRSFTDIPITTIGGVDQVAAIQSILATHDRGYFNQSAMLVDAMMRDDRISGVSRTRVGGVISADLSVKAADASPKGAGIAELLGGSDDEPGKYDEMFPAPLVGSLVKWGFHLGIGLAEIVWDTRDSSLIDGPWQKLAAGIAYKGPGNRKMWVPRLKLWHPQFVFWDWAVGNFKVIAQEGVLDLPRVDENPRGDGKWVLWTPFGYRYGWLDALVRSLADKYLMRGWNYRDWARFNERHGMATIGAKYPIETDKDVKERFIRDLSNIGAEAVVGLPQPEDGPGYELQMIEPRDRSFDSFQLFKKELDTDIAIDIIGQNLTTEGGTTGGSRALGEVQNLVRLDIAKQDAGIAACLRQQVLTWWAEYNFGDPNLAPRVTYQVDPPDDETGKATVLKTVGEAIGAHKTAQSPIDVRLTLDRFGIAMISEEEEEAMKAVAAEERAAQLEAVAKGQEQKAAAAGSEDDEGKDDEPAKEQLADNRVSMRPGLPGPRKRYEFQGLPIAVENMAGSLRVWTDDGPNGRVIGSTKMLYDYGFIEGHLSGDDEELDCYIGPNAEAPDVYVIHQLKPAALNQRLSDRRGSNAEALGDLSDPHAGIKKREDFVPGEEQLPGRGGRRVPTSGKSDPDSGSGDAVLGGDRVDSRSGSPHGESVVKAPESRTAVLSAMVSLLHDLKIRQRVVQAVPVDVVNDLISGQLTPEGALHHHPVLETLLAEFVVDQPVLRLSTEGPDVPVSLSHEPDGNTSSSTTRWVRDEDKCFLGFNSPDAAKEAFLAHRNDGNRAFGGMSVIPLAEFKRKLKRRTGTGKIRATAIALPGEAVEARRERTVEALNALAKRVDAEAALRAGKRATFTRKGRKRLYQDGLVDNAKRLAARALAVDLADLQADIQAATSFADLRHRIVERYRGMDQQRVASVVEKARLMAHMAGRAAALKEV